jgi:cyclase
MSTIHHDITTPGPPQVQEVDDGVFAYIQPDGTWWINNTGFLVGRRGVVSIDTCSTVRRTRAYLDAIRAVTTQPVRTVVNTHHHGDHTFGNFLFAGATIVGHEATRAGVFDWGPPKSAPFFAEIEWGEIVLEPPFLTYIDSVTVWVDDLRAEVRFVQASARAGRDAGLTPLETARELDLGEYADLLDRERIVGNLHRAYAELDGAPLGAPIDAAAALADMVAYNGGRPLSCLA